MVLRKATTRTFQRQLYSAELKTVTILKRDDDQREGVVRACKVFDCRRRQIHKTGEALQGDMSSSHRTEWCIPRIELDRVGIHYINSLDRIVESTDDGGMPINPPRVWQPEASTMIDIKLFENQLKIACLLANPPLPPAG